VNSQREGETILKGSLTTPAPIKPVVANPVPIIIAACTSYFLILSNYIFIFSLYYFFLI